MRMPRSLVRVDSPADLPPPDELELVLVDWATARPNGATTGAALHRILAVHVSSCSARTQIWPRAPTRRAMVLARSGHGQDLWRRKISVRR